LLAAGARLGPYEVIGPLGAGGMGEVYRARDTRLGRDVAIKVLPQHLSANPDMRARFEREARTVSGLNHPNICTLFDVGLEGDTTFLVMELVDGETLAQRLAKGPLPAADLLRFGVQIADALDRAHRAGVIHRDLKPGNVMLTRSGAKLMDFGLARATGLTGPAGASGVTMAALSQTPTVASPLTAEGTIVGTFQYMAPEQLEGGEADARSDIWALGCVLYEMATGRRAFEGKSQASLIAAILERTPAPIGETPSGSGTFTGGGPPPGLDRLIRNCLAKDPEERIQTAHDIKLQLQGISENVGLAPTSVASAPAIAIPAAPASRASGSGLAWMVAGIALLAAVGAIAWLYPRSHAQAPPYRFRVEPVSGEVNMFWPRVSPDGHSLMFVASDSAGTSRAFVRPLDQSESHPVPGAEGVRRTYWSPDGREIAFVRNGTMMRMPVSGGTPTVICPAPGGADLSWGAQGLILMDGQVTDSLRVVPAGGGDLQPATRVDRAAGEIGDAWPYFLPDGRHFLFIGNLSGSTFTGNIRLGRIGSLDSKKLGRSDGRVEYAPGGWVLYLRGSRLVAQKLDLGAAKLTGPPITLADDVQIGSSSGHFSISPAGVLAFGRGSSSEARILQLADRKGSLVGAPVATGLISNPRLSPDGSRLLYERILDPSQLGAEIYVADPARATDTRLTFSGNTANTPAWSPDGRRFAYITRVGAQDSRLHLGSADGLGVPDSIALPGIAASLWQWSESGSRLVCFTQTGSPFALTTEASPRVKRSLADSTLSMIHTCLSPDGRWMAGVMGNLPNVQVFVQSVEGAPGRWQISSTPGAFPHWTRGGRELVYEGLDGRMMSVDIDTKGTFRAGTPKPLFSLPTRSFGFDQTAWDVSADGEHFALIAPPKSTTTGLIEIATDFHALVSRK